MDFPLKRIGGRNMHFFESDQKSSIQLIFLPSGFNPELWKHQIKYFSRSYKTIAFQPESGEKDRTGEIECLSEILDKEEVKNAVLVSHHLGNSIAQKMEYNENVVGVVTTGSREKFVKSPPELAYRLIEKISKSEPKLVKKFLFSELADYRVVKEFSKDIELPDYSVFKDYMENYSIKKPVKHSMVVHAEKDRFSDIEFIRSLKPGPQISVIRDAGSFSFYEKPGDYNKALNDFLIGLEEFVERKELAEAKTRNRSLKEFNKKELKKVKVEG
ncbi:MAG: alpha/beta fold hydrolase [Candidatus Nanohaloarchaea archaeon]